VIVPDANLLLYAYDSASSKNEASRRWLDATMSGREGVGIAWVTIWAFLRISTTARVFVQPLSAAEAGTAVSSWLERPNVMLIQPGEKHWAIVQQFVTNGQCTGPLVMDAVLAAIVVEHGATLYTTDRDFSRFPGLEWVNPLSNT
jgi:toxin-antitoxin system PIN domain toxin